LVEALRYKPEGRGFDLKFFIDLIYPAALRPGVDFQQPLAEMSTRNISRGGKGGRCVRLTTLPPPCTDWKFGSLNLLEF
jgi:hypothetical protein